LSSCSGFFMQPEASHSGPAPVSRSDDNLVHTDLPGFSPILSITWTISGRNRVFGVVLISRGTQRRGALQRALDEVVWFFPGKSVEGRFPGWSLPREFIGVWPDAAAPEGGSARSFSTEYLFLGAVPILETPHRVVWRSAIVRLTGHFPAHGWPCREGHPKLDRRSPRHTLPHPFGGRRAAHGCSGNWVRIVTGDSREPRPAARNASTIGFEL
jgi:hypothetical protein